MNISNFIKRKDVQGIVIALSFVVTNTIALKLLRHFSKNYLGRCISMVDKAKNDKNSSPVKEKIWREDESLQRLLQRRSYPLSPVLDYGIFVDWLRNYINRKMKIDEDFKSRLELRELRRTHYDLVKNCDEKVEMSELQFNSTPAYQLLNDLDRKIAGLEQAIKSMTDFMSSSNTNQSQRKTEISNDKIEDVKSNLASKVGELESSLLERQNLHDLTPEYGAYLEVIHQRDALYDKIGLTSKNNDVKISQRQSGLKRHSRGKSFENTASDIITTFLIPKLAKEYDIAEESIILVRNCKFGMASSVGSTAEIDGMLCIREEMTTELLTKLKNKQNLKFCRVLAVIEVKRNVDDIGDAFASYQKALLWLCGIKEAYDPTLWKTSTYSTGHFEKAPFLMKYGNDTLVFTPESFRFIQPRLCKVPIHQDISRNRPMITSPTDLYDSTFEEKSIRGSEIFGIRTEFYEEKMFLDHLYFITKDSQLDNMNSKVANWILHTVSGGIEYDNELSNEKALESLRQHVLKKFPITLTTNDVIQIYLKYQAKAEIIVTGFDDEAIRNVE